MYIAWTMDQVIGTWFATTKLRSLLVRDTNWVWIRRSNMDHVT